MAVSKAKQKRLKNGQYPKGVSGNPHGRPRKDKTRTGITYLQATTAACSPEEWVEIVRLAVKQALKGDSRAREWLADRLMGKPKSTDTVANIVIDFSKLSDNQLERLANGEDPISVISSH
ncbi:MAG: DUF5681 domain-containing protein [Dehalococcoidales bacterium]